jgi:hypothetical protein
VHSASTLIIITLSFLWIANTNDSSDISATPKTTSAEIEQELFLAINNGDRDRLRDVLTKAPGSALLQTILTFSYANRPLPTTASQQASAVVVDSPSVAATLSSFSPHSSTSHLGSKLTISTVNHNSYNLKSAEGGTYVLIYNNQSITHHPHRIHC